MNALLNFIKGIGNAIVSVIDFVMGLFEDLVYMIKLLGQVILNIPNYFSWLPSQVLSLIVIIITVVVIYKILGREG